MAFFSYLLILTLTLFTLDSRLNVSATNPIIGYDCSGQNGILSRLDLTTTLPCNKRLHKIKSEKKPLQILQTKSYSPVHIFSCLLEITRTITFCSGLGLTLGSWSSRQADVKGSGYSYIQPIGKYECQEIHRTGVFKYNDIVIHRNIHGNTTTSHQVVLSGRVDDHGGCTNGGQYRDIGTNVNNKMVQGTLKLTVNDFLGLVTSDGETVNTKQGLTCVAKNGYCFDSQHGELVWTYESQATCGSHGMDVLYTGIGELLTDADSHSSKYLKIMSGLSAFALEITGRGYICGHPSFDTTQSRIKVIILGDISSAPFIKGDSLPENLDLTSYINTKFLLTHTMMQQTIDELYMNLEFTACQNRRLIFENRLALAKITPTEIGSLVEDTVGVFGRVMGEVLYITKCTPILVTHRQTKECYQELPVIGLNKTLGFLMPITRIFTKVGTQVSCSEILSPQFHIDNHWYSRSPRMTLQTKPMTLDPNIDHIPWESAIIPGFSIAGLYSEDQMRQLQREMMFPVTREAVSSTLADRVVNNEGDLLEFGSIFSETDLDKLAYNVSSYLSWTVRWLGAAGGFIFMIILMWKLFAYCLSVLINCRVLQLHKTPAAYRFAAMFDSLTSYLTLHKKATQNSDNVPLTQVVSLPYQHTPQALPTSDEDPDSSLPTHPLSPQSSGDMPWTPEYLPPRSHMINKTLF